MPHTRAIAQTPAEAYMAVNPDEALPSGDERYVNLDAVRGTRNIAASLRDLIEVQDGGFGTAMSRNYARFLSGQHLKTALPRIHSAARPCQAVWRIARWTA